jgi:undecaprenyl-diphosphatase
LSDYWISVVLGLIEGLTEFLPVSSTAHLRIGEALLNISLQDPYWKMYTIVIQMGAILAITLLFLRTFPHGEDGQQSIWNHPLTMTAGAFVVTAIPSFLLADSIGEHLESIRFIAWALIIGGIVMWTVDAWSARHDPQVQDIEQMKMPQALWIGFCQIASAAFPGTSRSMSTIAAGQLVGTTRSAALEFSFLLSIPTMFAATLYDLAKALWPAQFQTLSRGFGLGLGRGSHEALTPVTIDAHGWALLAIGFFVSFVVALGVVEWFLHWVRGHGFVLFALYRLMIGILLLTLGVRLGT